MYVTWDQSLDREDPLEKGTAIHSSILAWRIPWSEERHKEFHFQSVNKNNTGISIEEKKKTTNVKNIGF